MSDTCTMAQYLLAMVVLMLQVCWLQYEVDPKHGSDCAIVIACPRLQAKGREADREGQDMNERGLATY